MKFTKWRLLIVLAIIASLAGVAWSLAKSSPPKNGKQPSSQGGASVDEPVAGWTRFESEELGIRFDHPSSWGPAKLRKTFAVTSDSSMESGDFYVIEFAGKVGPGNRSARVEVFASDWRLTGWSKDVPLRSYPDETEEALNLFFADPSHQFEGAVTYEDDNTDIAARIDRLGSDIYVRVIQATPTRISDGLQLNYEYSSAPDPFPAVGADASEMFSDEEIETLVKISDSFRAL